MKLTPAQLHDLATDRWLTSQPDDPLAARYYAAMKAMLTDGGTVPARPLAWARSILRYEQFTTAQDRTPRQKIRRDASSSDSERHLGEWARYQRRSIDRLNAYQRARLDVSPAFAWDVQASAWERSFRACVAHRVRTGELPHLDHTDPKEFALARWLGRQLRELQQGRLEQWRAQQLTELLGG